MVTIRPEDRLVTVRLDLSILSNYMSVLYQFITIYIRELSLLIEPPGSSTGRIVQLK